MLQTEKDLVWEHQHHFNETRHTVSWDTFCSLLDEFSIRAGESWSSALLAEYRDNKGEDFESVSVYLRYDGKLYACSRPRPFGFVQTL